MKNHQREIALVLGYVLVALLSFQLGRFSVKTAPPEDNSAQEAAAAADKTNITTNPPAPQTEVLSGTAAAADCAGKIKGNISSSGKIYHLPGGAFYNRTTPEMCFDTETAAQAAGFRKSKN